MINLETSKYIRSLRCKAKYVYAGKYLLWLTTGQHGDSPERGELSYMAAQAVRMNLIKYTGIDA